jgi:hypothetical protein
MILQLRPFWPEPSQYHPPPRRPPDPPMCLLCPVAAKYPALCYFVSSLFKPPGVLVPSGMSPLSNNIQQYPNISNIFFSHEHATLPSGRARHSVPAGASAMWDLRLPHPPSTVGHPAPRPPSSFRFHVSRVPFPICVHLRPSVVKFQFSPFSHRRASIGNRQLAISSGTWPSPSRVNFPKMPALCAPLPLPTPFATRGDGITVIQIAPL